MHFGTELIFKLFYIVNDLGQIKLIIGYGFVFTCSIHYPWTQTAAAVPYFLSISLNHQLEGRKYNCMHL